MIYAKESALWKRSIKRTAPLLLVFIPVLYIFLNLMIVITCSCPFSFFLSLSINYCQVSDMDPDYRLLYKSAAPLFNMASWSCTWLIHGHVHYGVLVYKPNCDLVSSLSINLLSAKYTDNNLYLLVVGVWARYGIIPRVQKWCFPYQIFFGLIQN